jgi:hypothetical protein
LTSIDNRFYGLASNKCILVEGETKALLNGRLENNDPHHKSDISNDTGIICLSGVRAFAWRLRREYEVNHIKSAVRFAFLYEEGWTFVEREEIKAYAFYILLLVTDPDLIISDFCRRLLPRILFSIITTNTFISEYKGDLIFLLIYR